MSRKLELRVLHQHVGVRLSAYESAPWRLKRLAFTYFSVLERVGNEDIALSIEELYDYKGNLTVTWNRQPEASWKTVIELCWPDEPTQVEHVVPETQP